MDMYGFTSSVHVSVSSWSACVGALTSQGFELELQCVQWGDATKELDADKLRVFTLVRSTETAQQSQRTMSSESNPSLKVIPHRLESLVSLSGTCCKMLHRRVVLAEERRKQGKHPRKNEPGAKYKQLKHHCLAVSCCREHLPLVKSVSGYLLATRPDLIPVGPNFWIKVNRKGISDMPPGLNRNKHLEQSGILKEAPVSRLFFPLRIDLHCAAI